jgi:hypothetical protein
MFSNIKSYLQPFYNSYILPYWRWLLIGLTLIVFLIVTVVGFSYIFRTTDNNNFFVNNTNSSSSKSSESKSNQYLQIPTESYSAAPLANNFDPLIIANNQINQDNYLLTVSINTLKKDYFKPLVDYSDEVKKLISTKAETDKINLIYNKPSKTYSVPKFVSEKDLEIMGNANVFLNKLYEIKRGDTVLWIYMDNLNIINLSKPNFENFISLFYPRSGASLATDLILHNNNLLVRASAINVEEELSNNSPSFDLYQLSIDKLIEVYNTKINDNFAQEDFVTKEFNLQEFATKRQEVNNKDLEQYGSDQEFINLAQGFNQDIKNITQNLADNNKDNNNSNNTDPTDDILQDKVVVHPLKNGKILLHSHFAKHYFWLYDTNTAKLDSSSLSAPNYRYNDIVSSKCLVDKSTCYIVNFTTSDIIKIEYLDEKDTTYKTSTQKLPLDKIPDYNIDKILQTLMDFNIASEEILTIVDNKVGFWYLGEFKSLDI